MKTTAAILSLGALALAAPTQETQGTKVEYSRKRHEHQKREDGSVDTQWFLGNFKKTLLKYDSNFELPDALQNVPAILKRDTDANEPLTDQSQDGLDSLYYGAGQVNTQTFTFDFDTGSSDTFVPGPTCGTQQGCVGKTKYNERGVDRGNTTSITYGSGQVTGENYLDDVTIAGLTATRQNVISLTQAEGFANSASDGLMGMAFQSIANSKSSPYFFTLVDQGKVSPSEFSFYLGRAKSNTGGKSEMTLGGRDSSRYTGSFTPVPVSSQTYWQVPIDGVTVNKNAALPTTAGQAAIDTGTTLIIAPNAAALSIFSQIPGSVPLPLGGAVTLFAYPCASKPTVNLKFAGKSFAVNPLDLNFGRLTDDLGLDLSGLPVLGGLIGGLYCLAGIAGADFRPGENFYIVGDTFLKNWYSTYEYQSPSKAFVNFAKAV
ncbi:unnamed protein product [Zymoseptoria tritici ST99CH_1A5]|uniref:Aspartyl protease n=4 Tax=Zymoseptoria tritici TaxID=1047171 RepID=F9X915_ZYMTI|nr:aspartyl protease [Zymoseptoria tritici IPO323]SMQ50040.1 unnamed protein product [Zymoseptoria tritici ST99CH_3D7]SMR51021.1 unnamed protein product [Zymoseptoria tritici ST99CH_1E4]SMR51960.1 unnamed protein product [Zymoseptoria tritici ST99CH_3D1]SMY23714.1 unnamed protein product [Zymoseptoria tritici ST99CH_1A5]EGP88013.1 aspartyl protease [Zymoseptoria tritici IPO323]